MTLATVKTWNCVLLGLASALTVWGGVSASVKHQDGPVRMPDAQATAGEPPSINYSATTPITVNGGGRALLRYPFSSATPVTYQFRVNGQNLGYAMPAQGNVAELVVEAQNLVHGGLYDVVLTNSAGSTITPPTRISIRGEGSVGGQFIVVGELGTILTSPDGLAWTHRASGTSARLRGVTTSADLAVAVGDGGVVCTSPDGVTWEACSSGTTDYLTAVVSGAHNFVAVGGGESAVILVSQDGVYWSRPVLPAGSGRLRAVALEDGYGRFIAVGDNGTILTGSGGYMWTAQRAGTTANLVAVYWTGWEYRIIAENGESWTSYDGVTWSAAPRVTRPSWMAGVTWSGSTGPRMAVGERGVISTSKNGLDWTFITGLTDRALYGAAWSGGAWSPPANLIQTFDYLDRRLLITAQPQSVVQRQGDYPYAFFGVEVLGGGPISFQWRHNGVPLSGSSGQYLYINQPTPDDEGQYDVVVSNPYGSVTSGIATFSLLQLPGIALHPASQSVQAGGQVTFSVTASGTTPYKYQWRKGGVDLEDGGRISGATTATLSIANVQVGDAGSYDVLVGNVLGTLGSSPASLTVGPVTQTISFVTLPDRSFTVTPISLMATASSGLAVSFSVVAGPASLTGNQLTLIGTGTVTVRAFQPGGGSYAAATPVDRSFVVTGNFSSWRTARFTSGELADANISGPNADPDGDGYPNLLEYALGLEPKSADSTGLPELGTTATDWVYTYTRPADRSDLAYTVEVSTDLGSWTTGDVTHELVASVGVSETWRARLPLSSAANVFFRLKVVP